MSLSSLRGSGGKITNESSEYRDASMAKRKCMAYGTSINVNYQCTIYLRIISAFNIKIDLSAF